MYAYWYMSICICVFVCEYLGRPQEVGEVAGGCESPYVWLLKT